jgi:hypothetical protein
MKMITHHSEVIVNYGQAKRPNIYDNRRIAYPESTNSLGAEIDSTQSIKDYSKYLIDVICKFLESLQEVGSFPLGITHISLKSFVRSILYQSKISYSIVATGLLYLLWGKQSLRQKHQKYSKTIGIFELFVTALMLSSKYLNDRNAANSAWANISGIPLETLNRMEMKLLSFIEYKLHVEVDLFDRWIKFLFQPLPSTNIPQNLENPKNNKKVKMY